jgi:hypothetical protein
MRKIAGVIISLSLVAFGAAVGCEETKVDPELVGWTEQSLSGTRLTFDVARQLVQAVCRGTYDNAGQCVSCVATVTNGLLREGEVTRQDAGAIVNSFAQNECSLGCIPTSCAIEVKSCGSIDNGCGSEISCGSCAGGGACVNGVCPDSDRVRCICGDQILTDVCSEIDCSSGPANDAICVLVCANRGGLVGTGCIEDDPICDCGGSCPAGEFCVGGVCQPPEPGTSRLTCFCDQGEPTTVCVDIDCSGIAQDVVCGPICSDRGGLFATGCLLNACGE